MEAISWFGCVICVMLGTVSYAVKGNWEVWLAAIFIIWALSG